MHPIPGTKLSIATVGPGGNDLADYEGLEFTEIGTVTSWGFFNDRPRGVSRQYDRFCRRKGERTVGFDPMPNARLEAQVARVFVTELQRLTECGVEQVYALPFAQRAALSTLPLQPIGRRHRAPRPSKSDNPLYRNPSLRPCAQTAAA